MNQIDKELRHAIMQVAFDVARLHPEVQEPQRPPLPTCRICEHVTELMNLLDAEQREYGPPIDVTDPSYIRMKALER